MPLLLRRILAEVKMSCDFIKKKSSNLKGMHIKQVFYQMYLFDLSDFYISSLQNCQRLH
mgnify:CR=1 FL=1